jgi:hypothetical protein
MVFSIFHEENPWFSVDFPQPAPEVSLLLLLTCVSCALIIAPW